MPTEAQLLTKISKWDTNLGRVDQIVNGDEDTMVAVDGGRQIPSFAKLQAENALSNSVAESHADTAVAAAFTAEMARDQAVDLVNPANIFIDVDLAVAEAAVAEDVIFKMINTTTGLAQVRKRTDVGSDILYNEATTAALAGVGGSEMIGFRAPITGALKRHAQGKFFERISLLDFLDDTIHSDIQERVNNDDLGEAINTEVLSNPECRGSRIFVPPGLYNIEPPLILMQHMTLYGGAGREMMDNSANAGGDTGSRLRYRSNSGHLLTLTVPDEDNCRTLPVLRDLLLQHNRLLDDETENPDQVSGCTLYAAGGLLGTQGDRQLRYILDNVALYGGIDDNFQEVGNTYGSEIRYIHSMRAGRNGYRSINGPLGGEKRIGMMRLFQCGWNGTDDLSRANAVISAALVQIDQISSSEGRGPNYMLGGALNIGSMQSESGGLDVTAADRKQVVFGWENHGVVNANVANFIFDPGDDYEGAVVFHSRYASNVKLKGLFANTLGTGGRDVETEAPVTVEIEEEDVTFACGLIDVSETNASVFVDNSQRYCIKSGIEVRLRHGAHIGLTGNDIKVDFQPDVLYDPKNVWGSNRITAPHNMILDGGMLMALTGMDKPNHDRMRIWVNLNGADYRILSIDPSSATRAGGIIGTLPVTLPTIPMDQGDYVDFEYDVTGGGNTVGLVANESYLKLTALP